MLEKRPYVAWAVLAAAWIVAAVIVNPAGNFPLNDDWAYGRTVESLHLLGHLQFPGEVAVSLVAQSAWGVLFTKTFGFSFTVLRLSTLVAGLAGVICSFELFRALNLASTTRWLGTLCVGFTPLYLSLSYTFMTDVFFFTACVGTILFYVHFVRTHHEHHFWIALFFSLMAVFTRDGGIVVPAGIWIARLRNRRDGFGASSWRAWLPLLVCGLALIGYQRWLVATDRMPIAYGIHAQRLAHIGAGDLLRSTLAAARAMLCYLGLLLFPVLFPTAVGRFAEASRSERLRALAIGGALGGILVGWTIVEHSVLPRYVGNIFSRASLGPVVLPFASEFLGDTSRGFWVPVTLLAIAGAALLAILLTDAIRVLRRCADPPTAIVAVVAAIYATALLLTEVLDRYFLLLLPLAVIMVGGLTPRCPREQRWTLAVAVSVLAAMVGVGVAGTHDYLAWNRARWILARDLFTREPPERLDGGLEIDAWYAYPLERPFVSERSWWWIRKKPYVIALGVPPHYRLVARSPTDTWLPFGDGYIYLLQRE